MTESHFVHWNLVKEGLAVGIMPDYIGEKKYQISIPSSHVRIRHIMDSIQTTFQVSRIKIQIPGAIYIFPKSILHLASGFNSIVSRPEMQFGSVYDVAYPDVS